MRGFGTYANYIALKPPWFGLCGLQRSTLFFSLIAIVAVRRTHAYIEGKKEEERERNANCSLRGGSYELVAKLNFCVLNSFGIIIPWYRARNHPRACFLYVCCIMAKFDVYEFLTFNAIYKQRIYVVAEKSVRECNMNINRVALRKQKHIVGKLIAKLQPLISL